MKKMNSFLIVILIMITNIAISQEKEVEAEFTGENFSLEGALAIFKKSKSLEDFENLLNKENNNVNNLDLNNDGKIDYVTVEDIKENDAHVIVISTYLSEKEKQDIATIGIEKTGNESAVLQIDGDEELYAANTIVEPSETEDTVDKSNQKGGPSVPEIATLPIIVNVWFWPSVRFLYAPGYVVWASPYRWNRYPRYWRPWRPYRYATFYGRTAPHRVYYKRTPTRRVVVTRNVYAPRRRTSTVVVHNNRRTTVVHKNKRTGNVKVRTTKRAPARRR